MRKAVRERECFFDQKSQRFRDFCLPRSAFCTHIRPCTLTHHVVHSTPELQFYSQEIVMNVTGWILFVAVCALAFYLERRKMALAEWHRTKKPKYKEGILRMLRNSDTPKMCAELNDMLKRYTTLDSVYDVMIHRILDEMVKDGDIVRVSVEPNRYCYPPYSRDV